MDCNTSVVYSHRCTKSATFFEFDRDRWADGNERYSQIMCCFHVNVDLGARVCDPQHVVENKICAFVTNATQWEMSTILDSVVSSWPSVKFFGERITSRVQGSNKVHVHELRR